MRRFRFFAPAFLLPCLLALLFSGCANPLQWGIIPTDIESLSLAQWLEDVSTLESEMLLHPKLAADADARSRFLIALDDLRNDLTDSAGSPDLSSIAVSRIHKVLARVEDGHSRINASPQLVFPLIVKYFPTSPEATSAGVPLFSGWEARIVATDEAHEEYLGSVVARIGSKDIGEASELLASFLSLESAVLETGREDLRDHAVRTEAMDAFSDYYLMRGTGLAIDDSLDLEVWDQTAGFRSLSLIARSQPAWKSILGNLPTESRPFTRQSPENPWWYAFVPSHPGVLYFRYNSCDMDAMSTMNELLTLLPDRVSGETVDKAARKADDHPAATRLIVDLRYNSGGDSRPGYSFARTLAVKAVSGEQGGVIILTSGATFSSALMNAADILKSCGASGSNAGNAALVGESLIEPMRHYGYVTRFQLPNSGIVVGRSRRIWNYDAATGIWPTRGILEPAIDNIVHQNYLEYSSGIDPGFEKALAIVSGT